MTKTAFGTTIAPMRVAVAGETLTLAMASAQIAEGDHTIQEL